MFHLRGWRIFGVFFCVFDRQPCGRSNEKTREVNGENHEEGGEEDREQLPVIPPHGFLFRPRFSFRAAESLLKNLWKNTQKPASYAGYSIKSFWMQNSTNRGALGRTHPALHISHNAPYFSPKFGITFFFPGGTSYIPGWGGAARPLIPWPFLRQISLIFLPCLRQNSDFWYPV